MNVIKLNEKFINLDHLGTRESGKVLRAELEQSTKSHETLFIDFSGISDITQSFCDEAFGVIVRTKGFEFFKRHIKIQNASSEVKSVLKFVVNYSEFDRLQAIKPQKKKEFFHH